MASLPEQKRWEEVYQWETSDRALGGPGGVMNKPIINLTNRTAYLKEKLEENTGPATEIKAGIVKLSNETDSTSETVAATSSAVKAAMDMASKSLNASKNLSDLEDVTKAQANLGLGSAATKNIGNGAGQVPDMSHFPLVGGANGYVKLPNGFIFQWGFSNAGAGSANIAFPMQFPGGCIGVEVTGTSARASTDMAGVNVIANEINASGFGVNGFLIRPGGQIVPQGIAFIYCAWGY